MMEQSFSLIPFPAENIPEINITGQISRQANLLRIDYSLMGKSANILFPERSTHPSRKDELWKATCFEFFLALPNEPQYWEFNMSPSGDWNIYHMDRYRRVGFKEDQAIQQLNFSVQNESDCVSIKAAVDLNPILQAEQPIYVAITGVIQTKDGRETYWALAHPNPWADFHLRESFTIQI